MFSQKVEYALRAVVHLASEAPTARTVQQIATATKVPQAYLAKVIQELVHEGILRSQRGIGGGISMIKDPTELTVLEVVNAVDPIRRINNCPLNVAEHGVGLCNLHKRMDDALERVEDLFRTTTLAEILLQQGSEASNLCETTPNTPA